MDRIAHYRALLKEILATQAHEMNQQPVAGVDTELIIDETHDNYMLAPVGWSPQGRVRGATLYVRIRNGKFYVRGGVIAPCGLALSTAMYTQATDSRSIPPLLLHNRTRAAFRDWAGTILSSGSDPGPIPECR